MPLVGLLESGDLSTTPPCVAAAAWPCLAGKLGGPPTVGAASAASLVAVSAFTSGFSVLSAALFVEAALAGLDAETAGS